MTTERVAFEVSMRIANGYDRRFAEQNERWIVAKRLYQDNYQLLNTKDTPEYRIPKLIHQIWLGGKFPEGYKNWQKSWKQLHPGWEYVLWTDSAVSQMALVNQVAFRETTNLGARSDILRYEILLKYGGLYVDTDFECLQSFDLLHRICDFYTGIPHGKEILLNNALIAAAPGHPVIDTCVQSICPTLTSQDPDHVMNTTGPQFFTECFFRSYLTNPAIVVFPATYFYPFPGHLRNLRHKNKLAALTYIRPESYAIHYWDVSWMKRPWIYATLLYLLRPLLNLVSPEIRKNIKAALNSCIK